MRTDINLDEFKKKLEDRLASITSDQAGREKESGPPELDQARIGRLTRMDAMQQQAMSQAAARLIDQEKDRIKVALERVRTGDYGYCLLCDEEIAAGRLHSDPGLLTCISCARKTESRE
ncbi:MAG: TraR/DksA family transcriptional regulator [Desulfosudaceae bacterium]